jgi:hypothetical protein
VLFRSATGDNTQERAVSTAINDNVVTTASQRYRTESKAIVIYNNATTPAIESLADLTTLNSDGFTVTWTTNSANADIIHYIAIGGSGITNAKAGSFSLTTGTPTYTVSTTDPGFQPDFVMLIHTGVSITVDSSTNRKPFEKIVRT